MLVDKLRIDKTVLSFGGIEYGSWVGAVDVLMTLKDVFLVTINRRGAKVTYHVLAYHE